MSTREETSRVDRGDVPKGYVVTYHEIRGYDSPDRWYSAATIRRRQIGEFGTYGEAVQACKKDIKSK